MSNDHEWLNLIEVSGPFLAVPVLKEVFPQGLEALTAGHPQRLRSTYDEWREAVDSDDLDLPALHSAWIDEVLTTALEMDGSVIRRKPDVPERLTISMPEHGVTIAPDMAIVNPTNSDVPLLLIHVYEPDTDLDATRRIEGLAITPSDRMVALLRGTACPVGLITNGERWMLVYAPAGAVAGFASWYARLWTQEPETLRAFVSLLGVRRLFGPEAEKLPALFERSFKYQDDVTEALGEQVRRAVEVLVQALDRADQDRNRDLLRDVAPRELYEAGLTIMMRLVVLLAAEERGLLLLGDPRYDSYYAISSIRMQLRADSEEILERRRSSWSRLLALFRGVFGGIAHPTLRLPALGGSLFDPDRYPFLEGRKHGTNWRRDPAEPVPIDDRTVLLLLEAIQTFDGRTLSYRGLDVEQIGHVYEGLLERTVQRVDDVTLELVGSAKAKNARVSLGEIESARLDGSAKIGELLKERSERSELAIRNAIGRAPDERVAARLLTVCRGDVALRDRILPYAELLRTDPWGYPLVHHAGAFVVVLGADRRESGTHYTPKSLTEKIVEETLTPIVYHGPAEGAARENWKLKSPDILLNLKICDPAMGSGAFLVQACRYLAGRLVESWSDLEATGGTIDNEGGIRTAYDTAGFEPLSRDTEERAILAKRLIAERCLYGVDRNPLAVELAKLSLWLTTMSKGRPFGFLDHNLRSGDSLLGINHLDQLVKLDMNPIGKSQLRLFVRTIGSAVETALGLRAKLRAMPIRDIRDVEAMAGLDAQSRAELALPNLIADAFVGGILAAEGAGDRANRIEALAAFADAAASEETAARNNLVENARIDLAKDDRGGAPRRPFHWPIEFPEVFNGDRAGFDAIVGNPPFYAGAWLTAVLGASYRDYIVRELAGGTTGLRGTADLCCYFVLRAASLLTESGACGLVLNSTVTEGDSREVGLARIVSLNFDIYRASDKTKWPGSASVEIFQVWFFRGKFAGQRFIHDRPVKMISSTLRNEVEILEPNELQENKGKICKGHELQGDGFKTDGNFFKKAISTNTLYNSVIFPLVTGDWLNSSCADPDVYVINFANRTLEQAQEFPLALSIVEERVKPDRMKYTGNTSRDRHLRTFWWQFRGHRSEISEFSDLNDKYIALCVHTKYLSVQFISSSYVPTPSLYCILTSSYSIFAQMQSTLHEVWSRNFGSSLGETMRYISGRCFRTYPFMWDDKSLESIGQEYDELRASVGRNRSVGLTDIYNLFNSPACLDQDIVELRNLHRVLDRQVCEIFGWGDVDLEHNFYSAPYLPEHDCIRFTISEFARVEILQRLSRLNSQKHQEQLIEGLRAKNPKGGRSRTRRSGAALAPELTLKLNDLFSTKFEEGK